MLSLHPFDDHPFHQAITADGLAGHVRPALQRRLLLRRSTGRADTCSAGCGSTPTTTSSTATPGRSPTACNAASAPAGRSTPTRPRSPSARCASRCSSRWCASDWSATPTTNAGSPSMSRSKPARAAFSEAPHVQHRYGRRAQPRAPLHPARAGHRRGGDRRGRRARRRLVHRPRPLVGDPLDDGPAAAGPRRRPGTARPTGDAPVGAVRRGRAGRLLPPPRGPPRRRPRLRGPCPSHRRRTPTADVIAVAHAPRYETGTTRLRGRHVRSGPRRGGVAAPRVRGDVRPRSSRRVSATPRLAGRWQPGRVAWRRARRGRALRRRRSHRARRPGAHRPQPSPRRHRVHGPAPRPDRRRPAWPTSSTCATGRETSDRRVGALSASSVPQSTSTVAVPVITVSSGSPSRRSHTSQWATR